MRGAQGGDPLRDCQHQAPSLLCPPGVQEAEPGGHAPPLPSVPGLPPPPRWPHIPTSLPREAGSGPRRKGRRQTPALRGSLGPPHTPLQAQPLPPGVAGCTPQCSPAEATSLTWARNGGRGRPAGLGSRGGPGCAWGRVGVAGSGRGLSTAFAGLGQRGVEGGWGEGRALPSGTRGMRSEARVLRASGGGAGRGLCGAGCEPERAGPAGLPSVQGERRVAWPLQGRPGPGG